MEKEIPKLSKLFIEMNTTISKQLDALQEVTRLNMQMSNNMVAIMNQLTKDFKEGSKENGS